MSGDLKKRLGLSEFTKNGGIWKCLLAEFLGNMMLNFFGCASCISLASKKGAEFPDPGPVAPDPANLVLIALSFGLVIMMIVQAIGHISGGHVNPAVTIAFVVTGQMPLLKGLCYIVFQCLGAVAGSGIVKALTPLAYQGTLGLTQVNPNLDVVQGLGIEYFLGFVLIFVICGVCDKNKPECKGFAPVVIGLTIALGHLTALDYTGSSMNPARTFGSAVYAGFMDDHWVYWLGPILGGITAALIYKHAFSAPDPHPAENNTEYSPVQLKTIDNKNEETSYNI